MDHSGNVRPGQSSVPAGARLAACVALLTACSALAIAAMDPRPARQPSPLPFGPVLLLPLPEFTEQPATTPTAPLAYCAGLNCAPPINYPPMEPVKPAVHCAGLGCGDLTPAITPAPSAPAGPPMCAGLSCGLLLDPIAPSGAGTSPGTPCMGLFYGGSPSFPPSPPGPVPSDPICAGSGQDRAGDATLPWKGSDRRESESAIGAGRACDGAGLGGRARLRRPREKAKGLTACLAELTILHDNICSASLLQRGTNIVQLHIVSRVTGGGETSWTVTPLIRNAAVMFRRLMGARVQL